MLVTMAVIAVLISILAPSLSSIRETARLVICRSNARQIGIGITQFAADHSDRVPQTMFIPDNGVNVKPWETMNLRIEPGSVWDGLGLLFSNEYTTAAQVFYCPSHKGDHRYQVYADDWAHDKGALVGNFQYRGRAPLTDPVPFSTSPVLTTDRLSSMRPSTTLVADGFRTQSDFNHEVGANLFRADSSVAWFSDRHGSFSVRFADLPKDDSVTTPPQSGLVEQLWADLDRR